MLCCEVATLGAEGDATGKYNVSAIQAAGARYHAAWLSYVGCLLAALPDTGVAPSWAPSRVCHSMLCSAMLSRYLLSCPTCGTPMFDEFCEKPRADGGHDPAPGSALPGTPTCDPGIANLVDTIVNKTKARAWARAAVVA